MSKSAHLCDLYDRLDPLYREIWGERLHHGEWRSGSESLDEAQDQLMERCLSIWNEGETIADIGCGYGVNATILAERGCQVHAVTSSQTQAKAITQKGVTVYHADWLEVVLDHSPLDGALAIESLSHFVSFEDFARKCAREIRPGGSLIVADWFGQGLPWLASQGDLPPWRPVAEWLQAAQKFGFQVISNETLSESVSPTWTEMFQRSLLLPLKRPRFLPLIFRTLFHRPGLLLAFPLLRLAYLNGSLDYHVLHLKREEFRLAL